MAAGDPDCDDARQALTYLCETYWYPLYAYVRRRGHSAEDSADLTQAFFARLLEKPFLQSADRERGRFRSFLLTIFKRYLSNENDRRQAQKRGGGLKHFSIDVEAGEKRYRFEPTDDWTPEKLYERRWALTLLDHVMARLEQEYADKNKGPLFEQCKLYLTGSDDAAAYSEIAGRLEMSESALRVAVHRIRGRYRELLNQEVSQTLGQQETVDDELEYLRSAIRGQNMRNVVTDPKKIGSKG